MVNNDDVNTKSGERGEKDEKPESSGFNYIPKHQLLLSNRWMENLIALHPSIISVRDVFKKISIWEKTHLFRSMPQKECVEGKRDGKDEDTEDKIGKLPSPKIDQILEEWDKEESAKSHSYTSKTIGCTSLPFKPVGEDNIEGSNTETSDTYSNDHSEKKIELEKRLNLCAENKSKPRKEGPREEDLLRPETIDKTSNDWGGDHVGKHGYGLGCCSFCPAPLEIIDEGNKED
jgi:hypothetical protein